MRHKRDRCKTLSFAIEEQQGFIKKMIFEKKRGECGKTLVLLRGCQKGRLLQSSSYFRGAVVNGLKRQLVPQKAKTTQKNLALTAFHILDFVIYVNILRSAKKALLYLSNRMKKRTKHICNKSSNCSKFLELGCFAHFINIGLKLPIRYIIYKYNSPGLSAILSSCQYYLSEGSFQF